VVEECDQVIYKKENIYLVNYIHDYFCVFADSNRIFDDWKVRVLSGESSAVT